MTQWVQATDYILPAYGWIPSFSPTLTPKNRLYFAGGGGTVYYCDTPDTTNASPVIGQIAFYGSANYLANTNVYLGNVFICTPITSDRYGNIFFGFQVTGSTPLNLASGIARIDYNGTGTWLAASNTVTNALISQVAFNCAPALSNDHKTLYIGVNNGYSSYGYLVAVDSRTLAPLNSVRLKDVKNPTDDANVGDDGTSSPTVGPDGDVFYGVLETNFGSHNGRGWLLHFDSTLATSLVPGGFGWDDTASVVPVSMLPSYGGSSGYLLMTKYNNYEGVGSGDGSNRVTVIDPHASQADAISGIPIMKEVLTVLGPTFESGTSGPVKEWCINTAAVDPLTNSILVNSEDGYLYRWDMATNRLTQRIRLTSGIGESYTPTVIGADGAVYAVNNAVLFSVAK